MATTVFNDTTADHKWNTTANWSAGKPDSTVDVTIASTVTSLILDLGLNQCKSFDSTVRRK
jgi:hypothetical protein